ncbi:MAG: ABC transporter permease [Pseudonocardiales bacterium]|nr:MAG: ABC transporter permease [Pseudonocardiales bacterium]
MNLPRQVASWLSDGSHWKGSDGVPAQLATHLELSGMAVGIALAVALPIGLWLGHVGRGGALAINISNVGRAIPTYALLVILFVAISATHRNLETVIALVAFAIPPILTNTYVGLREVDPEAREAARGMGMNGGQLLRKVEVPLAMPLIMDGVRIAVVQVIATTTVAALIGVGGLGRFVTDGFISNDPGEYGAGAVLVAALALTFEGFFAVLQRRVDPARRAGRRGGRVRAAPAEQTPVAALPAG